MAGALLFLGLATSVQAQFTYTTNNGTITITSITGFGGGGITIPNVIDGMPVTEIASNSFSGDDVMSVSIPDSVTSIGAGAFSDTLLPNVAIPESVTNLGAGVFEGCQALTAINVASNNPVYSSIGGVLFNKSATALVEFPGGLSGSYNIPLGITDIESNAFAACSLTSVSIPDTVSSLGDYAFSYCPLTNVTIPDSVTSIGSRAFSDDNLLPNVTVPESVTNIGTGAFEGYALTAINVAPGNLAYSSVAGVLFNQTQTTLLEFPVGLGGSYAIPASVLNIGATAFENCSVTSVTLSLGLVDIGSNAFTGCPLTSVIIPDSVTNIGDAAFYNCYELTNVTFSDGLTSIGAYAFSGSFTSESSLGPVSLACRFTSITVPASITNIVDGAFEYCFDLTNAYFLGNAPSADSTVFAGDPANFLHENLTAYYLPGTTGWPQFTTNTGVATALWTLPYPLVLNGSSGVQTNQFGFTISWATNVPVVVEASANLSSPAWTPIATNTLDSGVSYFSDPQWTNYPARFYRLSQ